MSLRSDVLTVLALTWLNPHVYLDTVLLLGSVANTHGDSGRWWFGAAVASIFWFIALGYGARLLTGMFAWPLAWRILDGVIAATHDRDRNQPGAAVLARPRGRLATVVAPGEGQQPGLKRGIIRQLDRQGIQPAG